MVHLEGLAGVKIIEKGFNADWKHPCCEEHKIFIKDFAFQRLISLYPAEINNSLYLHCFKRCLFLLGECNIGLEPCLQQHAVVIIRESLAAFLEAHNKTCQSCGTSDCAVLLEAQSIFTQNDIREKLQGRITTLLCKWSTSYQAPENFVDQNYRNLTNPELRNAALNFLLSDLLISEGRRELNLKFLKRTLETCFDYQVLGRMLSMILKNNHLSHWFSEHIKEFLGSDRIEPQILVTDSIISYSIGNSLTWNQIIDERTLRLATVHGDDAIRLLALKCLCCHPRLLTPLNELDLELVLQLVSFSLTIESPSIRDPMVDCLKKLFNRMCHILQSPERLSDVLEFFETFLHKLHDVCVTSLDGSENFNRRFFAFHILRELHSTVFDGKVEGKTFYEHLHLQGKLSSEYFFEVLVKSLDDSYEKCQDMAATLLLFSEKYSERNRWTRVVDDTLNKITAICAKTQHGVVFKMKVITECCPDKVTEMLDNIGHRARLMINEIRTDLQSISTENPIHTVLNAMSAITSKCNMDDASVQKSIVDNVIMPCFDVMEMVNPVLHSISPEGMILEADIEEGGDDMDEVFDQVLTQKMQSQRLLVACWRTLKAVSEIFSNIIQRSPDQILLNQWSSHLPLIVNYFWNQLTECRHRGAFEMASECFKGVCIRMKRLFNEDGHELNPNKWLDDILETLNSGKGIHRLVSTRRSAGLPHLVTAILAAFQPEGKFDKNESLARTMRQLLQTNGKSTEIEVHSANVLKAIVNNRIFKTQISDYIEQTLKLSIDRLPSSSWNLRNAYSQLFAAITLRIFGPQNLNKLGTGMSAFEFFTTYQSLYPLFLNILNDFCPTDLESVDRATAVSAFLCHIKPTKLSSTDKFCLISFVYPLHYIAFTGHSDHTRTFAVKAIKCLFQVDSLVDCMIDEYLEMLDHLERLPSGWITSLCQLIHHILVSATSNSQIEDMISKFISSFNRHLLNYMLPDLTIHHILTVYLEIKRSGRSGFTEAIKIATRDGKLGRCLASTGILAELVDKDVVDLTHNLSCLADVAIKRRDLENTNPGTQSILDSETTLEGICSLIENGEDRWDQLADIVLKPSLVEVALPRLRELLKVDDGKAVRLLAIFLQDEERAIRQKASDILCSHLFPELKIPLFPRVMYAKICSRYAGIPEFVQKRISVQFEKSMVIMPSSAQQRIFEECSPNTFSEPKLFDFESRIVETLQMF